MVGQAGFEPTTPSPPVKCATRLRYCPPCPGGTVPGPRLAHYTDGQARWQRPFCGIGIFFCARRNPLKPRSGEQLFQLLQLPENAADLRPVVIRERRRHLSLPVARRVAERRVALGPGGGDHGVDIVDAPALLF